MRTFKIRSRRWIANRLAYQKLESRNLLANMIVTTTEDVIDANDGRLSLREAIIASNSNHEDDTIVLAPGDYLLDPSTTNPNEDLSANGDLDILSDGGHRLEIFGAVATESRIWGTGTDRVFHVHSGSYLQLNDIVIGGGGGVARGGGLLSLHSTVEIRNVTFLENVITGRSTGGAVWIAGGNVGIVNSVFRNNSAGENGSAIFLRETVGSIMSSRFEGNSITNNLETGNFDHADGTITGWKSSFTIRNTRIDRNVGSGVGAIESNLTIDNVRFLANLPSPNQFAGANAIHSMNSELYVNQGRFTRNGFHAIRHLGHENTVSTYNSMFLENGAATSSGAEIVSNAASTTIMGCMFDGSLSSTDGFLRDSVRAILGYDYDLEHASIPMTLSIVDCVFEDYSFQAIFAATHRPSSVLLDTVNVRNTYKTDFGIQIAAVQFHINDVLIKNSTVEDTGAGADGVWIQADRVGVILSTIQRNQGFGLRLNATTSNIVSSTITRNGGNFVVGGGIFLDGTDARLLIANSEISNNNNGLGVGGGALAIAAQMADVTIVSSTMVNNRALGLGRGGAIWAASTTPASSINVAFSNTILWQNYAPHDRIFSGPANFTVSYSIIEDDDPNDNEIPFGGSANHNLDDIPGFVDWLNGDYRLKNGSPAINAGTSATLALDTFDVDNDLNVLEPASDRDLVDRIFGGLTDIGAFEYH